MKAVDAELVLVWLLASVILAHLVVGIVGVTACLWAANRCAHVDWRFWFGEPLAAVLGLLGGRALERGKRGGVL